MSGLRRRWHKSEKIFMTGFAGRSLRDRAETETGSAADDAASRLSQPETNADDPYWRITESFLILAWPPHWMPSGMAKHENIAKALKARLSELMTRVGEINSELRKPLSADLEEQATDLENQGALEAIENSEIHEIHQIQEALKRISEGTYGICADCGEDIDPKRLPGAANCD
jgi:DnaK suppressor protein